MSLDKKLLIGFGTLAVLSLIIGFAVSNASAKAEVKAREIDQAHRQTVKAATVVESKKVEQAKAAAYAKVVADAKIKAEADLNTVPATGSLFDLSVTPNTEEARVAKVNGDKAVQDAIANQKKEIKESPDNSISVAPKPIVPEPVPLPVPSPVPGTNNTVVHGPLKLIADDSNHTYLGKLTTNKFDSESVSNEFGTYGSKFSSKSIYNEFGTYGGKFSQYSPFNEFTSKPPLIVDANGSIVGRLSVNKLVSGAISPYTIFDTLTNMGS